MLIQFSCLLPGDLIINNPKFDNVAVMSRGLRGLVVSKTELETFLLLLMSPPYVWTLYSRHYSGAVFDVLRFDS